MSTLVKILRPDLYTLEDIQPATLLSAGLDLKLAATPKGSMELAKEGKGYPYNDLVGTGLAVAIPPGYVGLLLPRSSAGHKRGLRFGTTAGVIDSDYRGELMLSIPAGCCDCVEGETVAQLIVVACDSCFRVVEELEDTARGSGGFGSTDLLECPYCPWKGTVDELDDGVCPQCLAMVLKVGGTE